MAIKIYERGKKFTITFRYKDYNGKLTQQYEAYESKQEAKTRVKFIEFLRLNGDETEIAKAAYEYNQQKIIAARPQTNDSIISDDNRYKTFSEFIWKWVPIHARKVGMKPNPYSCLKRNIKLHIEPYFGNKVVSLITPADIDDFLFQLSKSKSNRPNKKNGGDSTTLKTSTQVKIFNILSPAFRDAEIWGYTDKNPVDRSQAPSYKYEKRKFWKKEQVKKALAAIDDPILHLAVHLAFICSLRPGEVVGTGLKRIDLKDKSISIDQTLSRVDEADLKELSQEEIIFIFPKKAKKDSKSVLILKTPKTENSERIAYLNAQLSKEIEERIQQIEREKSFYGEDYHDYGLLFCFSNGDPMEPRYMDRLFKKWQISQGIEQDALVDMQGLRKSATMYKLRLTNYNLQVVGGEGGQSSPTTILNHYDEVLEEDRRKLSALLEDDFYYNKNEVAQPKSKKEIADSILKSLAKDPDLLLKLVSEAAVRI